ncbi:unnamed protein product, partial [Vitis vinifera]
MVATFDKEFGKEIPLVMVGWRLGGAEIVYALTKLEKKKRLKWNYSLFLKISMLKIQFRLLFLFSFYFFVISIVETNKRVFIPSFFLVYIYPSFMHVEAQLNFLKKETQNYTSRCATEAKKLVEDAEIETHNVDIMEREVADVLETSKLKL